MSASDMQRGSRTDPIFTPTSADLQFPAATLLSVQQPAQIAGVTSCSLPFPPTTGILSSFNLQHSQNPASSTSWIRCKQWRLSACWGMEMGEWNADLVSLQV